MFRFLNIRQSYVLSGLVDYIVGEESMEAFLEKMPIRKHEYLIYYAS